MTTYSVEETYVTNGNDYLPEPEFGTTLDLGDGLDFVTVPDSFSHYDYSFDPGTSTVVVANEALAPPASFTLINDDRLVFNDAVVAFDLNGDAGQAYRLYEAALDRAPDRPGLSYWTADLDHGATLHDVANQFIASPEFQAHYGVAPSDEAFVTL